MTLREAIVVHLGLKSVNEIIQVNDQGYRFEVILEDGGRRITNKLPIMEKVTNGSI